MISFLCDPVPSIHLRMLSIIRVWICAIWVSSRLYTNDQLMINGEMCRQTGLQ
jgi:hypothetical protein